MSRRVLNQLNWRTLLEERVKELAGIDWDSEQRRVPSGTRVGFKRFERRTPDTDERIKYSAYDFGAAGRPLVDLPPPLLRRLADESQDQPCRLPASPFCIDESELSDWLTVVDGLHDELSRLRDNGGYDDDDQWLTTNIDELEKFVLQSGRWRTWYVSPNKFTQQGAYKRATTPLDDYTGEVERMYYRELADNWPEPGSVRTPVKRGKLRGWPTYDKGKEDTRLSLLLAARRWERARVLKAQGKDDEYIARDYHDHWVEYIVPQVVRHLPQGDLGEDVPYKRQIRTGGNRKLRPVFELRPHPFWPVLSHMEIGDRSRTRDVDGAAYPENVDDQQQGHYIREAYKRSVKLSPVLSHGDEIDLVMKTRRARERCAIMNDKPIGLISLIGLDVSGCDEYWTPEIQEAHVAAEAACLPLGHGYRGAPWRLRRIRGKIVGPGIRIGDNGFLWDHEGYNPSGIGTTDTDNNAMMTELIVKAVAYAKGWTVEKAWKELGISWFLLLKGDDTVIVIYLTAAQQSKFFYYLNDRMKIKITIEGGVFLATSLKTGSTRAVNLLLRAISTEWFRGDTPAEIIVIAEWARLSMIMRDDLFDRVWRARSIGPWSWSSPYALEAIARECNKIVTSKEWAAEHGPQTVYLWELFELLHHGDHNSVIRAMTKMGFDEKFINSFFTLIATEDDVYAKFSDSSASLEEQTIALMDKLRQDRWK